MGAYASGPSGHRHTQPRFLDRFQRRQPRYSRTDRTASAVRRGRARVWAHRSTLYTRGRRGAGICVGVTGRDYAARGYSPHARRVWAGRLFVVARTFAQLSDRVAGRKSGVAAVATVASALWVLLRRPARAALHAARPSTAAHDLPRRLDDHPAAAGDLLPVPPSLVALRLHHRLADIRAVRDLLSGRRNVRRTCGLVVLQRAHLAAVRSASPAAAGGGDLLFRSIALVWPAGDVPGGAHERPGRAGAALGATADPSLRLDKPLVHLTADSAPVELIRQWAARRTTLRGAAAASPGIVGRCARPGRHAGAARVGGAYCGRLAEPAA